LAFLISRLTSYSLRCFFSHLAEEINVSVSERRESASSTATEEGKMAAVFAG